MENKTDPILSFLEPAFNLDLPARAVFVFMKLGVHFGLTDGRWHPVTNPNICQVVKSFDDTAASRSIKQLKNAGLIEARYHQDQAGIHRELRFTEKGLGHE